MSASQIIGTSVQQPKHTISSRLWLMAAVNNLMYNLMYPSILSFGGNTGAVNSFTGVNLEDLTGRVLNAQTLFECNLACFFLQASLAAMPTQLDGLVSNVGQVLSIVTDSFGSLSDSLSCPQLDAFDNELFKQFPGAAQGFTN